MIIKLIPSDTAFTIWSKPYMNKVGYWNASDFYIVNLLCLRKSVDDANVCNWWLSSGNHYGTTVIHRPGVATAYTVK